MTTSYSPDWLWPARDQSRSGLVIRRQVRVGVNRFQSTGPDMGVNFHRYECWHGRAIALRLANLLFSPTCWLPHCAKGSNLERFFSPRL